MTLLSTIFVLADVDPLYCFTEVCMKLNDTSIENVFPFLIWIFKIVRLLSYVYSIHVCVVSMRTINLLACSKAAYRTKLFQNLEQETVPNWKLVRFYRECHIVSNTIRPFDYIATTFVLVFVFISFAVFVVVVIVGLKLKLGIFVIIGVAFVVFASLDINVVLMIGCSFFTSSQIILSNWKRDVMGNRNPYIRRCIISLGVIAMPAGEAGVIDVQMKVNYFKSLLDNVVNSVSTFNSIGMF